MRSADMGLVARPARAVRTLRLSPFTLTIPASALLIIFFTIPVLVLLLRSVLEPEPGLGNYAALLGSTTYLRIFSNTFIVSAVVTLVTLAIGFPVAWTLALLPPFAGQLVFGIILLSMWTNLLVRTYAWMVLLQRTGIINKTLMGLGLISEPLPLVNNLTGVTIGMTYIMLPFVILPLYGVVRKIDGSILQAAALCGTTRFQALCLVFLPLVQPGLVAGGLMVFVMSLGYFITPALLGGTANMMLAELITQFVQSLVNWGMGGAAALILLTVTLALYALQLRLFGTAGLGGR